MCEYHLKYDLMQIKVMLVVWFICFLKIRFRLLLINKHLLITLLTVQLLIIKIDCFFLFVILIELILGSMTDSVCTAYESRKQPHDSSSNLKGILFII